METTSESRGRPSPLGRRVAVLGASLFFFGPALAFAAGDRATEIENRRLAGFPALSPAGDFPSRFEAWAVDHLPLRGHAVRAQAMLSEELFGEPPSYAAGKALTYPRVVEGREGWLYFGDDVAEACRPVGTTAGVLARVRRLGEIVRASGRRFVFTVAPDKTTIYPDKLPDRFLGERCLARRKEEFWKALDAARVPGYLDLRGPLERLQRATGEPAYFRTDSHWSERSAALYGAELARTLQPDLSRGTRLVPLGSYVREGDLGRLLGASRSETTGHWGLVRTGCARSGTTTVTRRPPYASPTPPPAPRCSGRTRCSSGTRSPGSRCRGSRRTSPT
ncbi:hypothetical protein DQ384_02935 [Sphaerisporangium album]|uniref:AlgX/AlgJ SGNH hydrolase-like domain-containing protein n=1 Tax=Sphaerisporangium album TaxID=509200 RepID=A0A367FPZ0_9ACTN|nr:hypothetical protein [Sphaerisporangium album]RCG32476.1 hypothetical protein DQ384_02935 [Sphaerisporangium album]